jgi:integrase
MSLTIHKNEVIKRRFYEYLKNSKGFSKETIGCYENAIWLWEDFSHKADFADFNKTTVGIFKDLLKTKKKANSQENISLSYCYDILRYLKFFFEWLSKQAGYKSRINQTAIDYLNLTRKEVREATQPKDIQCPTLEEIKTAIENIKGETEIEMRDKALFSLAFLTGARITAIMTLPMESFNKKDLILYQDPKLGVKTKNSKNITSALISFSYKEPLNYFLKWFDYLEKQKKFKPSDPIFPATKIENGKENLNYYNTGEVEPIFWKSSSSPRKIFEKRFEQAGVKYYHPHTFRHLLVKQISKLPITEEQKKAFSQNLGHEHTGTTFGSYGYGHIETNRQIEVIRNIDFEGKKQEIKQFVDIEVARQLFKEMKENKD